MVASPATIQRVADTFRQAAELNRATPSRRGNVVVIEPADADELMIAADLHGHRVNYQKLLAIADLAHHPRRHLIMQEVCHGGPAYPSGGCMSHLMLEDMARLKTEFPERFHFILSNHELSELTDFPITKGRKVLNLLFRCGLTEMYGEASDEIRAASCEFLASLPLAVRCGGNFICHSLPEYIDQQGYDATVFDRPLKESDFGPQGAAFRLVWGRDFRAENADNFARLVKADLLIHGHEPCAAGFATPNSRQVILDSCCEHATYLMLKVGEKWNQQQTVQRIQRLK